MKSIDDIRADLDTQWSKLTGKIDPPVQIMEVCGTHTVAAGRAGLHALLPDGLRLISGPGCPVCVTDQSYMDQCVHLAREVPNAIIATYGDMLRVPGRLGSLEQARAEGATVEVVYSADAAVDLAAAESGRHVAFLGIGFETTTPGAALAIRRARAERLDNFSVFSTHKRLMPAMGALLAADDIRIHAFLCPGHVSVILGWEIYAPVAADYGAPCVVAGFEDEQILAGVAEIVRQLADDAPAACSVYPAVTAGGNAVARELIDEIFTPCDDRWRGLGLIPDSGHAIRDELAEFDTARRFDIPEMESYELPGCRCGDVICGRSLPTDCPLFSKTCNPRNPVGPCMVSSEGSCAAHYRYHYRGG